MSSRRTWLLAVFLVFVAIAAWAAFTSQNNAGTATDAGDCWTNDGSTTADDETRAEAFCAGSGNQLYLHNFGFTTDDIEDGATVTAIRVFVQGHGGAASQAVRRRIDVWVVFSDATDCNGGTPGKDNVQFPQNAEQNFNWNNDDLSDPLWQCSWTPADIRDTDFGIRIMHTSDSGSNVIGIDFVWVEITFTPAPVGGSRRAMVIGG